MKNSVAKWAAWVATCGGIGYFPLFPGTIGSLAGLLLFLPLQGLSTLNYGLFLVVLFGIGVYTSTAAEPYFQRKDASHIVIDELHAMLLVSVLLPPAYGWWIAGFVVFRCFDIKKPPPIRAFEKWPGGWGVMADDFVAALYTVCVLRLTEALMRMSPLNIG
ncbi:MAG: phosphatidylglycerophosphatase A [Nitrospiria bacterium]